jgi:hypothetical protein
MINGIGYQEYKKMRRINEQLTTTAMEMPGNERYVVYFGRAHVIDFETGVIARGHLKIGRGKFVTALQRGRNQPGIDFRVYGEIVLDSNQATHDAENIIKEALAHRHIVLSQGQQEMYQFKDDEINNVLTTIAEIIEIETSHTVIEINLYYDNKPTSIKQSTEKFLIKENNTHNLMFG